MKKLFFTAIALVAFSGVSMAAEAKEDADKTVSCTRRSTTTCEDGTSVTVSVTASVPSTGDFDVDQGAACSKAATKAKSLSLAAC